MSSSSLNINSRISLPNSSSTVNSIPPFGLGTWRSDKGQVEVAVYEAISAGYRHIDCAWVYGNEEEVGNGIIGAIKDSNNTLKREDLFITSKLWNTQHSKEQARKSLTQTLKDLQTNYLDLYLIHWPVHWTHKYDNWAKNPETKEREFENNISLSEVWAILEEFVKEGLVKNIGVSNFSIKNIQEILSKSTIKPVTNQIELHPYWNQAEMRSECAKLGITVTAYCPLGNLGRPESDPLHNVTPLKDEVILKIAQHHNKSPAQIIIRWHLQIGVIVIPKSVTKSRIIENANIYDFSLNEQEMKEINQLGDKKIRFVNPDFLPGGAKIFDQQSLSKY